MAADAFGFENLFMQSWRLREKFLDIIEETTGGRVIFGSAKIGGVRRDITPAKMDEILKTKKLGAEILAANCGQSFDKIMKDFNRDYWMSAEESVEYGIVDAMLERLV